MVTYCPIGVIADFFFTRMVTDCGGIRHGSWDDSGEEAAVGSGTMQERFPCLCDKQSGNMIAVRAQHGISASVGVAAAVTHSTFPINTWRYIRSCFHMTTTVALPHIVLSGLKRCQRIGSMHSLDHPWDPRSKNLQRWCAGDDHDMLIVADAPPSVLLYGLARFSSWNLVVISWGVSTRCISVGKVLQHGNQMG